MPESKTIGNFDIFQEDKTGFRIKASFSGNDFKKEWSRCNYLSNYIAEYSAYNFDPGDKTENLISTVLNEMIERLSLLTQEDSPISVTLKESGDHIIIDVENMIYPDKFNMYERVIQKINTEEIGKLYLENITIDPVSEVNELEFGFVMLANDFKCRISSRIQDDGRTTTRIAIKNEEARV